MRGSRSSWPLVLVLLALAGAARAQSEWPVDFDLPNVRTLGQYILLLVNLDEVVETVAFYTCLGAVLLIVLGLTVVLRQPVWTAYGLLVVFGLVWVGLYDQNLTGIYWSGLEVTPRGLLLLGHVMISANFLVAAGALPQAGRLGAMRWPLVVLAALAWAGWWMGTGRPLAQAQLIFNGLALLSGLSHGLPFSTFSHVGGGRDRVLHIAAAGLALAVALAAWLVSRGQGGAAVDIVFVNRIAILAVSLFLVGFFLRRIFALRRDREAVIARSLEDARREAETSRRLLETEKQFSQTREVARLQRMRLATASHDIRQPITSLRATMDLLARDQPPEMREHLRQAFDYLDQLAASYMEEAKTPPAPDPQEVGEGREQVSTRLILDTLERMFAETAREAGKVLEVRGDDMALDVPPLVVMRVLSNLLSNAITHGEAGPVRLTLEARGGGAVFRVTNRGEPPGEDAFAEGAKGAASPGSGLGLAISEQLAARHGMALTLANGAPGEVVLELRCPLADPAAATG